MSNDVPVTGVVDMDAVFDGSEPVADDDVVFECLKPHWEVSREGMKQVLQIVNAFPAQNVVYVALWREGSNVCVHANNRDAFVDYKLSILNVGHNDFVGDRVYFVESDKLLAFINAYKKFVFSFDEKGDIYYESPFTEYRLDNLSVALKDVRVSGEDPLSLGWVPFPLSKAEVGVFKSLYGFAVKDSDSKMLLDGDKAEAFYSLYQYAVRGVPGPDGKVVLRKMDLPIIHEISDGDLYWACTKDRLYFKFGLGVVSFLRVPYDEDSFMYPATFATGEAVGKFRMDIPLVRRALRLVEMLGFNEIEFVQDDESILMVSGGKVRFSVGTGSCHSFGLDAFLFGKIMGTIDEGEKYVDVFVSERGLDIVLNRDIVCTYSLSRTTVTQMRVADKTNMRLGVGLGDTETVTSSSSGASVSLAVKEEMVSFQDADLF